MALRNPFCLCPSRTLSAPPSGPGVGLIVNQQNRLIDTLGKRIDELWEDVKGIRRDQKETRQKVDELPLKIMELLRTANHPVSPDC